MRFPRLGGFLLLVFFTGAIDGRNGQALGASSADDVRLSTTEFTLKNGMQFLIVERHESATFSAYLRFKVGSANELRGQTGVTHLLEHMIFKGTRLFGTLDPEREVPILDAIDARRAALRVERAKGDLSGARVDVAAVAALEQEIALLETQAKSFIVRNELWDIYRENGAVQLNASTSREGTQYFVSLPKNRLELWALLESDRMRDPVFREFYTERSVVQEERRQRVDTDPSGQLYEAALAAAYVTLPYRHPVLGWSGDLERLSRSQAEEYFRMYYAPNNALAVLVGDLDPAEVRRTIERYFETLPPGPPPPASFGEEPPQLGERRIRVEFPAEPQLLMLYHLPRLGHEDAPALTSLGALLGEGRNSRLYRRLVEEKRLVTGISAGPWLLREAGLSVIQATPQVPQTLEEIEGATDDELASATAELPRPHDLLKVRNGIEASMIRGLASTEGLAYAVSIAFPTTSRELSLFRATLQTKNENVPRATTVILEEMRRMQEEPVMPQEPGRTKETLGNSFVFRFTSRFRTVVHLLMLEFDGYPSDYYEYENLLDRYRAVTAADIQRVARQYLHPEVATILVVGDATHFESAMAAFGPVHRLAPAL